MNSDSTVVRRRLRLLLWGGCCAVALAWMDGCAAGGAIRLDAPRPLGQEIVWPAPPDPARIRHVRTFASTEDLGFRRSFLGRFVDFLRGRDRTQSFQHPYGITVTEDDRVYVVDSSAKGLHEFDLQRGQYRFHQGEGFVNPVDVTVDSRGRIFVSDSEAGVVIVLDPEGDEIGRIAEGLVRPTGVVTHPGTGELYIVDTQAHQVVVFDETGASFSEGGHLTRRFGTRGSGPGQLNYPTLIAIGPTGDLYVSDALNFRIQVFSSEGEHRRSFGQLGDAVGEFARPKGLAVDTDGRVFVVEGLYDVVNVFDPDGRLLMTFGGAGRADGNFWLATGLAVDYRGRIFVADSYNGRVQAFQLLSAAPQ